MPKLKFKDDRDDPSQTHKRKLDKKRRRGKDDSASRKSSKRRHTTDDTPRRKWASSDEDEPMEGAAQSSGHGDHRRTGEKPDFDTLRAEMEEQRFREKIFDALGDDERLDGIEAQMNNFAHVPNRWRSAATGPDVDTALYDEDDFLKLDPATLDDEEYAEWVRLGMWRKTHAAEHAEQLRRKAEAAERAGREKARRREARRFERDAEEERRRQKQERHARHMEDARAEYQSKWKLLLSSAHAKLNYHDIPWPIAAAYDAKVSRLKIEDFTMESISAFLLPSSIADKQERKERLRESFLRFHPDKFEGRFMQRIVEGDVDSVRETIGQVSRTLNSLLESSQA